MTNDINEDDIENDINKLKKRLDKLEKKNKLLANRIKKSNESLRKDMKKYNSLLRKDVNRLLDGTEESPGILKKLDNLSEIVKILDERLPK